MRVGRLVLDGDVILPADGATVNERRKIGYGGLIAVALPVGEDGAGRQAADPAVRRAGRGGSRRFHRRCDRRRRARLQPGGDEEQGARGRPARGAPLRDLWTGKKPVVEVMLLEVGLNRMAFTSILAIYFLFFAFSAFLLLPFGVRTDEEVGTPRACRGRPTARRTGSTCKRHLLQGGDARRWSCSRSITPTGPTAGSRRTISTSTH